MVDLNTLPLYELYRSLVAGGLVQRLLELARDEDLGTGPGAGDATSAACIPADEQGRALLVARQAGVVAGLAVLPDVLRTYGFDLDLALAAGDGERITAGSALAFIRGPLREILAIERLSLNLVGRLSGIATLTSRFVEAAGEGGAVKARIFDTRKTTPGLRMLEKYAVRCGGGYCHRAGLYDAVLIKDNHLAGLALDDLADFVAAAVEKARKQHPDLQFVQIEADTLEQFERLLTLPAGTIDIVLLDNMTRRQLREAVAMRDRAAPGLELEASGGVRLETVRQIAETGVDRISIGALTHSAAGLDVALDIEDGSSRRSARKDGG